MTSAGKRSYQRRQRRLLIENVLAIGMSLIVSAALYAAMFHLIY